MFGFQNWVGIFSDREYLNGNFLPTYATITINDVSLLGSLRLNLMFNIANAGGWISGRIAKI